MQEVNMRVKSIEEELQEDDDGHKSDIMKDSQGNFSGRGSNNSRGKKRDRSKGDDFFEENSVEDDGVNIGDKSLRKS